MQLHPNPIFWVQIVENALARAYTFADLDRWARVHDYYTARYLNPDSPYKAYRKLFGR